MTLKQTKQEDGMVILMNIGSYLESFNKISNNPNKSLRITKLKNLGQCETNGLLL